MYFYRHICNKLSSLNTYKTNLKKAYKYFLYLSIGGECVKNTYKSLTITH